MRNVLVITAGLGSLAAIAYLSASTNDCEAELSGCLGDPPLFVQLKGAERKTYCLDRFKACLVPSARTAAEKAAALAAARQEAADAVLFTRTIGVAKSSTQIAEPFDFATIETSGD